MRNLSILIFFTCLISLLCHSVSAQEITERAEIVWSNAPKAEEQYEFRSILLSDESGTYTHEVKPKFINSQNYICQYNEALDKRVCREIEYPKDDRNLRLSEILVVGKQIWVICYSTELESKKYIKYAQHFKKEELQLSDPTQIAEIDFSEFGRRKSGYSSLTKSNDETKLLAHTLFPKGNKGKPKGPSTLEMFDLNMNSLWKIESEKTEDYDKMRIIDTQIDSAGNIHFLLLDKDAEETVPGRKKTRYNYHICSVWEEGTRIESQAIRYEGKCLTDMKMRFDHEMNYLLVGFYSTKGTKRSDGPFLLRIDGESGEIMTEKFEKFDYDFLLQYRSKKSTNEFFRLAERIDDNGLERHHLEDVFCGDDGSVTLIAEEQETKINQASDESENRSIFKNVIIVKMSLEGEIVWTNKLVKKQVCRDIFTPYLSYGLAVVDNTIHLVFNDNADNLMYDGKEKVKRFTVDPVLFNGDQILAMVTIDNEGNLKRELLQDIDKMNFYLHPKSIKQTDEKNFMLGGSYQIGRLEF